MADAPLEDKGPAGSSILLHGVLWLFIQKCHFIQRYESKS
jgi:hypothetical protein